MTDEKITELYLSRSEDAISESARKYGKYCFAIANGILRDRDDALECVNDAYLRAWNSIPPKRPEHLGAFLARITRNAAINRYKADKAKKRGGGELTAAIEEFENCLGEGFEDRVVDSQVFSALLDSFLASLGKEDRIVFVLRYFELLPVKKIASDLSLNRNTVKTSLYRSREKLKKVLTKGGFDV